ncbi:MAG: hypothetical protein AAB861_02250, partial [Patescibacteria group bacterium]
LINAKEIGEILDAVLDAAVNRVAREGLSLMKTGPGSWTAPRAGGKSYKAQSKNETKIQGLEGILASETLTNVLEFKTSIEKLTRTISKLGASTDESKITKFTETLYYLPQIADDRTCGSSAVGTQQKIQRCFYDLEKNTGWAVYEDTFDLSNTKRITWGDGMIDIDFNKEENNPSAYKANQLLHEKAAELWSYIFTKLERMATISVGKSCRDISFTSNPDDNQLPIFFGGSADKDPAFYDWTGKENIYAHYIIDDVGDSKKIPSSTDISSNIDDLKNIANERSSREDLEAKTYDTLIENLLKTKDSIDDDSSFADSMLPGITLYANVMMDYDKAGKVLFILGETVSTTLVAEIKKYNDSMESKDNSATMTARKRLMKARKATEKIWQETQENIANDVGGPFVQAVKDKAQQKLDIISSAVNIITDSRFIPEYASVVTETGNEDVLVSDLQPGDIIVVGKGKTISVYGMVQKGESVVDESRTTGDSDPIAVRPGIKVSAGSINLSVEQKIGDETYPANEIQVEVASAINESLQTGTGPSEAVGKAMLEIDLKTGKPYLPFSIEQLENDLEMRGARISKLQTEMSNKIGKFLTD